MITYLLLLCGLLLILLEFYVPGGVIGVLGGIFILASLVNFGSETDSISLIILYTLFILILIGVIIRLALWNIVHAKPGYSIYLKNDQEGFQASKYDHQVIGKIGIVFSDLKPGGYILVDGKQHQAISLTGYISKGESVDIISGQEESLIVKRRIDSYTK
jgi:membrane-bound serine protease (ClpP class)